MLMPLLAACGKPATPALLPPQTFNFAPQAISFAPPPAPWAAEREQSGGIVGVRYVEVGSVGEAIGVGDYYDVSGRLREPQLAALLAVDSDPNDFPYSKALRNAWPRTETPYSDLESAVAERVNDALQRAEVARRARDFDAIRMEVAAALADAQLLHFTLKEVIDRAIFKPEQSAKSARYKTLGRRDILVAGEPAVVLDLTLDLSEGKRYLRKVYVLHNDHLFIAELIDGVETEEVKVWDRLSHNAPEHRLFIADGGHLFMMTHALAGREHSIAAYDAARTSLQFVRATGGPQIAR